MGIWEFGKCEKYGNMGSMRNMRIWELWEVSEIWEYENMGIGKYVKYGIWKYGILPVHINFVNKVRNLLTP